MDFTMLKDLMDRLTSWRIPGNSISVCLKGKEVFSYQSGYSDLENRTPMTEDKLFNIYSCSKVTTVTAALQLYERGLFLLDDPLYDFIPEYREMFVKTENGDLKKAKNPITLRNLFTMTSGLTYNMDTDSFKTALKNKGGKLSTLEAMRCPASDPLSFEPGTHWQYSMSHDVLAAAVEVISGQRFADYVRDNIFLPLGMNDSFYHATREIEARMAEQYMFVDSDETDIGKLQSSRVNAYSGGYPKNFGKLRSDEFGSEFDSGGAGIITSVSDYSKLCAALAGFGKGANGEMILSKGTVELLRTNQIPTEILPDLTWDQLKGYGYGLGVRTLIDKARSGSVGNLGEFGWGGAAGATVLVDPDIGLSVFYAHHMLNPQESYYQPRLRNVVYACIGR